MPVPQHIYLDPQVKKEELNRKIISLLKNIYPQALNFKQLRVALGYTSPQQKYTLRTTLAQLEQTGKIRRTGRFKYAYLPTGKEVEGIIELTKSGNAYLISPHLKHDAFIRQEDLDTALEGDRVRAQVWKCGKHLQGRVKAVIERAQREFVGTVDLYGGFAMVKPLHEGMPAFLVKNVDWQKVRQGERVSVRFVRWEKKEPYPEGEIVRVLSRESIAASRSQIILLEHGFPLQFPQKVLEEAERLPETIPEEERQKRRSFVGVPTFTIDPEDARDFDDALSIRPLSKGKYEIGIHIADVSWYVRKNSALDQEARRRGTSVYLVDMVLPMLPERLSSWLCSLVPNEERLSFSVVVTMDASGNVYNVWMGKTIIKSMKRFTYSEAQKVLTTSKGQFANELQTLWQIAQHLRQARAQAGALMIDSPEPLFELDEQGAPISVSFKGRYEAHFLIEEFMLLANRLVAQHLTRTHHKRKAYPTIYRVHDHPPPDKLKELTTALRTMGYSFATPVRGKILPAIQKLLEKVHGKPEQHFIEQLVVRSMARAFYSPKNFGHFGLQFPHYTHFTSPIRRYPDLVVHRILHAHLQGAPPPYSPDELVEICFHASRQEMEADKAEWDSIHTMEALLAERLIGHQTTALLTGVNSWALFLQLDHPPIEATAHLNDNPNIHVLPEKMLAYIGRKPLSLGSKLIVQITGADPDQRRTYVQIIEPIS